jgi:dihydrofolate synthase/folylpolyglutamate synthase
MALRNIQDYFNYLYKLERTGMKYDLSNITKLCNVLNNPQVKFKSIHIAGTNGKGATASFIASVLQENGYKTGLFTSPHILNFNERIRINGKCIDNTYIKQFLTENLNLIRRIKPSFFEVNTALAFKYFADKNVEVAVIECGLGGRLDSTNIIKPDVSVITQIDMDHMQFLGNTLKNIAMEKLGIVREGVKVIVNDNNSKLIRLFHRVVPKKDLLYLDDVSKSKILKNSGKGLEFTITPKGGKTLKLSTPLSGKYQIRNAAAAYFAVNEFMKVNHKSFSLPMFKQGIKNVKLNTGYFGRLEIMKIDKVQYLLDVSHNPDGIKNAIYSAKNIKFKPDVVIFGIMSDKDHKAALKEIMPYAKNIIFTKPEYDRALEPGILYSDAFKMKHKSNLMVAHSVKDSLLIAQKMDCKKVMILGSFFIVSDALKAMGIRKLT